jgi:positive regulator of sigma E activity
MKLEIKNSKPLLFSWIVTVVLLFVATIYSVIVDNTFGNEGIIFFTSLVAYFAAYIIFKGK